MKLKKLIAIAATLTMAMSSMTVMAEEITGDVNYVDTTVYRVTLPTTAGMSFTLDPQGLTALDVENGDREATAGSIVATGTMTATNESSVPVVLEADFFVVDSDTATPVALKGDAGITANADNENKEDAKEIQLTVSTVGKDTTGNVADNTKTLYITQSTAGTPTDFNMAAATYDFTGTSATGYKYVLTKGTGSTIDMTIGGKVAKDYDWSDYVGEDAQTITLNAVFKFYQEATKTNDIEAAATDDYVMVANEEDGSVSYTFINAPEGTLTALSVDGQDKSGAVSAKNVKYENGILSFNATSVGGTGIGNTGSHTIKATIGEEVITLTYSPSEPTT